MTASEPMSTGTEPRRVVVVGYNIVMAYGLQSSQPDDSVIFIEEPAGAVRRNALATMATIPACNRLIEWDYLREDAADEFFLRDVLGEQPAAILPGNEYATLFAARLAERYGLPGAGLGAAGVLRDKSRLRRVSAAAGVPNPLSRQANGPDDIEKMLAEVGGPVIVKPSAQQASAGVSQVHSADQAAEAFRFALDGDEGGQPAEWTGTNQVLVEQYVAGREFSVEMLVSGGQPVFANVTAKQLFDGPRPIERGHVAPYDEDPELVAALTELTGKVVQAAAFGTGLVHCEWIVGKNGPMLVECAGRVPGDGITVLVSVAWGIDLMGLYASVMAGSLDPAQLPDKPTGHAAVAYSEASPGIVTAVIGEDVAGKADGAFLVMVLVGVGEQVRQLRSSHDRVALVMATGDTAAEATAHATNAAALVVIETSPDHD
jgi:biotin carboxylase